ncbi:PAS domain S-box protein [Geomonas sp. Red69]|uniref:histidine kinase n=1 Tax=Geomonas diazotrophica TaxID=2843197 RepID=A0ABX8JEX8_9BACT|nr:MULTISPECIES: ATP-binding protein [Geomonas]MBU5635848.1 PAS domain S-box protein [Geomonas diazotrophica]QWV96955.1 PAS domain S-box protein [Geomonas nitrogeniifigens]QXE86132.1 PAS domain S-box protein [Geomonas nitrogeniifigens]
MHFAPLLLIVACELLLLLIEQYTPLPGWLHFGVSVSLATVLLCFVALFKQRQETMVDGLRREIGEMQQEAAKSARRYKSLLEGAGNAIFIFNVETAELEEENRLGRELFGFTKDELGTMVVRDLLDPCEHERVRGFLYQLVRQGEADWDEVRLIRKDGSSFLGEINARLIDLGDEQVAHCLLRDITEKRRTEREIWQRNRELSILNNMLTSMNLGTELKAVQEGTLLQLMELFRAEGGTLHLSTPDTLSPTLCASKFASPDLEEVLGETLSNPEGFREVCIVPLGTACQGWGSLTSIPVSSQEHLIGVIHLIHREPHSYAPEELRFLETVGKQMGSIIEQIRLFTELKWKSEELLRSHRLLEKSSHNLSVSETKLKQNLALVERAHLEQVRLDRMKNQFLGMVSHEFNTPLTSILSGVDHLLQQGWSSQEDACRVLEMVRDGGLRLKALVADLLKLIRLESRREGLETSAIHLRMLLETLLDQLQPLFEERGQVVTLRDLDHLPFFQGDCGYLERVFYELLLNAIRFSPEGGEIVVNGRVVQRKDLHQRAHTLARFNPDFLRRCGDRCYLEVEVRDCGIGIPLHEQQGIFEIFYEVGEIRHHSSGRRQGKGAGLGLAIVKGMVEAHGGMVWVESNDGSSFFLVLPLEQELIQPALF